MTVQDEQAASQARLHAIVHGRVQGVSFRYYAVNTAQRLNLTGWVANRWDGTVEVVAEGDREALQQFLALLHEGSPYSRVARVVALWQPFTGEYSSFTVQNAR